MILTFTRYADCKPSREEIVDHFRNDSRTNGKSLIRYYVKQSEVRCSEPMSWEEIHSLHFKRFTVIAEFDYKYPPVIPVDIYLPLP